jgi:hypothetical protein
MKLPIVIKVTQEDKYDKMVKILSSYPPLCFLSPSEKDVYSALLYLWHTKYKHIQDPIEKNELVFSKRNKEELCNKVGISIDRFYNIVMGLKKHKLMEDKDILNPKYAALFDDKFDEISFIIKLDA